jgi:hypothetical protein
MMGWFFLNLSIAAKQHQIEGSLTLPMFLYQSFAMVLANINLIVI